jgi:uncharacterized damage-inducible protein DinB
MPESQAPAAPAALPEAIAEEFLRVSRRQLQKRANRIEFCVGKLNDAQLWHRLHENENAVGNLVIHLAGNVRQWIICGVGGAEDRRDRAAEFARRDPLPAADILERLRSTLEEADAVLARLDASALLTRRKIQVYDVTVLEAVFHVVEHFAEHTGQIIWATKRMTGEDLGFYGYLTTETGGGGKKTP